MDRKVILSMLIVLLITACSPPSTTEETNTTNTTLIKYTVPDEPSALVNATKTCQEQIDELEEQKTEDEYDLLQIDGDKQKLSMELQFKKDSKKFEKEIESLTDNLQDLSQQSKDLKADIESKKDAIRLLEEKCDLKK